jgi:hypothetical protein
MPDLWLDVDVALTEVPVNLLPLLDDTDFKTREVGIVYNQAGMDLVFNFTTTAGVTTQTAVTPTTAGDYDWAHQGDGMYTIEIPASGGVSINNDTEGFGWFTGFCTGVLPWRSPTIGFRAAGLNNLLIDSAYSATRGLTGTALPDAAADAAGGLPISDLGGLDLDTQIGTDIDAILVDTGTTLPATLTTIEGKVDTVDTNVDAVLVDTGTTLDAALAVVDGNVDAILVDTGTTLPATLTTIDGKIDTVDTNVDAVLVDTGTTLDAALAVVDANVDAILVDTGTTLDAALAVVDGNVDAILADTNELQTDWVDGGRLDNLLDGASAPSAATVADAVWDEAQSGHVGAGTFGEVATEVASILADTNELQTDDVPGLIGALNDPTAAAVADAVWDEAQSGHVAVGSFGEVATEVASILADTNELQTDNIPGTLTTIEGKIDTIDTNVDAVLVDTGTTLDAALAVVDANVDAILVDTSTTLDAALAVVDGNVDSILVDTGTTLPATLTTIEGKVDTVDANVDAILVDTSTTLDAALAVVDGNVDAILVDTGTTLDAALAVVDANVDAILADTGTTLPATLTTIEGKVDTVDGVADTRPDHHGHRRAQQRVYSRGERPGARRSEHRHVRRARPGSPRSDG